jgi:hypothetical protein
MLFLSCLRTISSSKFANFSVNPDPDITFTAHLFEKLGVFTLPAAYQGGKHLDSRIPGQIGNLINHLLHCLLTDWLFAGGTVGMPMRA